MVSWSSLGGSTFTEKKDIPIVGLTGIQTLYLFPNAQHFIEDIIKSLQ